MTNSKRMLPIGLALLLGCVAGAQMGCEQQSKSPDVKDSVKNSLDQAGLHNVNVSQDRDKGVVTLSGTVVSDADKSQAESIAKSAAAGEVVANQITVAPPGDAGTTKEVQSDRDKAIEKNVDAALTKHQWNHAISVDVKNGVVTLKGKVNSQAKRAQVEKVVSQEPDVSQVVNEIEVTKEKATSSSR